MFIGGGGDAASADALNDTPATKAAATQNIQFFIMLSLSAASMAPHVTRNFRHAQTVAIRLSAMVEAGRGSVKPCRHKNGVARPFFRRKIPAALGPTRLHLLRERNPQSFLHETNAKAIILKIERILEGANLMKHLTTYASLAGFLVSMTLVGCNLRESTPSTILGNTPKSLAVNQADPDEVAAVKAMELARADYKYRLEVLQGYYYKIGFMDKYNWATQELRNLNAAQQFSWENIPTVTPPGGESLENADERQLVEYAVAARQSYSKAVSDLESHYDRKGESYKRDMIRNVQKRYHSEETYTYIPEAEIPPADLRPTEVIPEADRLFEKACKLFRSGKGLMPGMTSYRKERQAQALFLELIHTYPRSTKIALSAYYIADIYKEYFNKDVMAVKWYERAWQWDPNITEPARFQAATIYDYRLQNKSKAVECYRESLKKDPSRVGNYDWAQRRIRELTQEQ